MRRVVPGLALLGLGVLTACTPSTSPQEALNEVSVSGQANKEPSIKTGEDFHVDDTVAKVLRAGDGPQVSQGDTVTLQYVGVNGSTGAQFDSSYDSGTPFTTALNPEALIPGLVTALDGKRVGGRILVAVPPKDGYGKNGNPQAGVGAEDTLVFVVDIEAKPPSEAAGEKQTLPSYLPRLTMDSAGHPEQFEATDSTRKKTPSLQVEVAIRGDGPKVEPEQTLTVQYVGQIYPDGEVFDKSWGRAPASFQIGTGGLIACWDKGLLGQRVGSREIMVCPPGLAYGKQGNDQAGISGKDTLIFAVDILAAEDSLEQETPTPDEK